MSLAFKPRMTRELSVILIPHAEDDSRRYPTPRKISMQHRGAFPTNRFEDEEVRREQKIDRADQFVLCGVDARGFAVSGDDLECARQ